MHLPLQLSETQTGPDAVRLGLAGELDIATAAQFREAAGTLLGTGCRHVVVDLSQTTFVDSCGLGALVWAAHRFRGAGGDLTTANACGRVEQTMRVTGLTELLELH